MEEMLLIQHCSEPGLISPAHKALFMCMIQYYNPHAPNFELFTEPSVVGDIYSVISLHQSQYFLQTRQC